MGAIIRQIARTALLCGTLGLLLYLALAGALETPTGAALLPPLLGVAGTMLLLILTAQDVISARRSGVFPSRSGVVLREREPVWFRVLMIWQTTVIFALIALLVYVLTLLGRVAGATASITQVWH